MADIQIRRLPVVNRDNRLVGIIAIADLAANGDAKVVGEAMSGIFGADRRPVVRAADGHPLRGDASSLGYATCTGTK